MNMLWRTADYNLSASDSLRGRFVLNRSGSIDTSGYPASFFTTNPNNSYLATFTEFHNFTPNLTNELRFGYNRNNALPSVPAILSSRARCVPEYHD